MERANLGKNGEFKGLARYKWDDKKGHLDKWQFCKNDKFGKIYAGWQKRHVDNCRFYENDIFCEFDKGIIEGQAKNLNETTEEAYWQLAIFAKMANLRKRGIGKESIKFLAKPQLRWQRGKSWQMAVIIRKWQTLVEQRKFRQKWRVGQKFIKSFAKYSKEMTKRGILTNGDFTKITNLAKIYLRFGKFKTRLQKRHVHYCGFYETGEFGKDWDNKTTKEAYWQLAIFTKMESLRKWGIGQESINGLAKSQIRCVTKKEILT